jgi:dihydrofolate reductase
MVLGRRTYQIFAAYWPNAPEDDPFGEAMNRLPKYVASRSLTEPLAWQNSTLIAGDLADGVRALKEEPGGDLNVIGSGDLTRSLMEHDLVDTNRLMIHTLLLGSGRRLFGETGRRVPLRLVDSKTTGSGVLILSYEPER